MRKYASLQERLLANSVRADVIGLHELRHDGEFCWIWTGTRDGGGYGSLQVRYKSGPRKGKQRRLRAHRASVMVFKGRRVTPRMVVLHLCNNRACINPAHLVGGSQKENVRQCVRDGRHWSGLKGRKPQHQAHEDLGA